MKDRAEGIRRTGRIDALLSRLYGDPGSGELQDPLETLVLTVLSQNTNDVNRDRAYASLREAFPAWEDMVDAPPARIASAIRVGGLARQKGRRIREILRWVRKRFKALDLSALRDLDDGEIRRLLSPLRGVGPKTLAIVLLFALGREAFPVDTHVRRLLTRLGVLAEGTTAEKAHEIMAPLVRPGRSLPLHLNLIRFGRERCTARNPRCAACPLGALCVWPGRRMD